MELKKTWDIKDFEANDTWKNFFVYSLSLQICETRRPIEE